MYLNMKLLVTEDIKKEMSEISNGKYIILVVKYV